MEYTDVDSVRFTDGEAPAEMRGYDATEHSDAWLVWHWHDESVRIPAHRVKDVVTTREWTP